MGNGAQESRGGHGCTFWLVIPEAVLPGLVSRIFDILCSSVSRFSITSRTSLCRVCRTDSDDSRPRVRSSTSSYLLRDTKRKTAAVVDVSRARKKEGADSWLAFS